ncbi:hypothetical protein [Xanthobacter sp.]|uniref:hypothetical protein n=1 Tax=Xanthobacter sp. TaxID=35809 RepID=UPI0025F27BC8|nr:hypothetical protein [Xanthobacter sp.]
MAAIPTLRSRRQMLAADYEKATRRHARCAALSRTLVQTTCDLLRAEIRAERQAKASVDDLFSRIGAAT